MDELGIDIEVMSEILCKNGVELSNDNISDIVKDYNLHKECQRDVYMTPFLGQQLKTKCSECAKKDDKIHELEYDISIYEDNVKKRLNVHNVYVDRFLRVVKYDLI